MSRLIFRRLAVLMLLAALGAGLVACGDSDDKSSGANTDATALLKDTFGADHPIRSGRLDANLDVDLKGLARFSEPLSLHLAGPFQSNGGKTLPDFALDLDLQGGQKPVTVGAVFAKGRGYLTIEGQAFDLGAELYKTFKTGYEKAKASAGAKDDDQASFAALGIAPLRWLQDPKNLGTEDIAGTQTVHLGSGVNVAKLLEDVSTLLGKAKGVASAGGAATGTEVPTSLTVQQRELITKSIKSAKVDIWTGAKDHTLRKVAIDVQVDVPENLRARAGNLRTGHVIFQVTFAQLNQAQKIVKPADVKPISELRSALESLGVVGGTASTTAPSTTASPATTTPSTPTTPATGPQADYAQCITDAGEDLAKVQDCAQYLDK